MHKQTISIIGSRGLVGRIITKYIKTNKNYKANIINNTNLNSIKHHHIVVFCKEKHEAFKTFKYLRQTGWNNYWIDASACFRQCKKAIIVLDPLNKTQIKTHIKHNTILCGGNCTVSILLLALKTLILKNLITHINCVTLQAISGMGFLKMKHKLKTIKTLTQYQTNKIIQPATLNTLKTALTITPWIGESNNTIPEEELKGKLETRKILKNINIKPFKIDSTCIRVNTIRCHTLVITLKLKQAITKHKLITLLTHDKTNIVSNTKEDSIKYLNPNTIAGQKKIYIGRIRQINNKTFKLVIIGDQLIWGASEPLIRTLNIVNKYGKPKN